ncbi:MAG: VCBS repeat-containing protein [Myxococcaceae bacterium]|nr:VCBS repeat-containing protein [Myxococcaceae bacterium]
MWQQIAIVVLFSLSTWGCRGDRTQSNPNDLPTPTCGDGHLDTGEECDGSSLGSATCLSLGFDIGTLSCDGHCKLVTAQCSRRCGNGTIDTGEECDGALGVSACATFGYQACSASCALERGHCVTVPFQSAPSLTQDKGGPAVIADLPPKGFGDLVMALVDSERLATFSYTLAQGFIGDRMISVGQFPVLPAAAELTGDGLVDLAAINADGTADRYVSNGNGYVREPLPSPDGGCIATAWLGSGPLGADAGTHALTALCADAADAGMGVSVWPPGASGLGWREASPIAAAIAADVTKDGVLDVVSVSGASISVRAGPGFALASMPISLPEVPRTIAVGDFDGDGSFDLAIAKNGNDVGLLQNTGTAFAPHGTFTTGVAHGLLVADLDLDGRPDVAWFDSATSKLQVRRNMGQWTFSPFELATPPGTFISLAAGDLDGDGDGDLALTLSTGATSTITAVFINKVR